MPTDLDVCTMVVDGVPTVSYAADDPRQIERIAKRVLGRLTFQAAGEVFHAGEGKMSVREALPEEASFWRAEFALAVSDGRATEADARYFYVDLRSI